MQLGNKGSVYTQHRYVFAADHDIGVKFGTEVLNV